MCKRDNDNMKFKPFLNIVNVTIDYCGYSNRKGVGGFLLDVFIKDFMTHGNVIQPCPLHGHIYLNNFTVDLANIPFFFLNGEYMAHFHMYSKVETNEILVCSVYGDVKSK